MRRGVLRAVVGAVALAAAGAGSAAAQPAHVPVMVHNGGAGFAVERAVVLYSQNTGDSGVAIVSQNFEAEFDGYDVQAADDFAVPSGVSWTLASVGVPGTYFDGTGPAASETVTFYKNAHGVPGVVAATKTAVGTDNGTGSFTIPLGNLKLRHGRYWISVQANMDLLSRGEWGWEARSPRTGKAALWQNPGDGFATGCTAWARMETCNPSGEGPDLMFALNGTQA
jgi:hypothetical protein